MNIMQTINKFNEVRNKIANELNVSTDGLTELNYFKYTESTYNGHTHSSTIEEWLRKVIPLYL